jgi:hypothetical protein
MSKDDVKGKVGKFMICQEEGTELGPFMAGGTY